MPDRYYVGGSVDRNGAPVCRLMRAGIPLTDALNEGSAKTWAEMLNRAYADGFADGRAAEATAAARPSAKGGTQ
jgi:hypothetical protein